MIAIAAIRRLATRQQDQQTDGKELDGDRDLEESESGARRLVPALRA
jgi:hypothetical protein